MEIVWTVNVIEDFGYASIQGMMNGYLVLGTCDTYGMPRLNLNVILMPAAPTNFPLGYNV